MLERALELSWGGVVDEDIYMVELEECNIDNTR